MKETSLIVIRSEEIYKKVLFYFEEKNIFLDENISLEGLSKLVGTNTTYLSNTINKHCGCNLHTFINTYRIHYAENLLISNADKLLVDGKNDLKNLYKKSGFASRSAFYVAFHNIAGTSPWGYLIQYKKKEKRDQNRKEIYSLNLEESYKSFWNENLI